MCINFVHFQNIISLEAENNLQIENHLFVIFTCFSLTPNHIFHTSNETQSILFLDVLNHTLYRTQKNV